MTKRPSIANLAPKKGPAVLPPDPHPVRDASPVPNPSRSTAAYKAVLAKVDDATHRQLKILSVNEDTPIGDLFVEALNLLFRSRELPEIAVKVTPDETARRRQ